jgi:hypothetical protein
MENFKRHLLLYGQSDLNSIRHHAYMMCPCVHA